jgi:hypothetical protein
MDRPAGTSWDGHLGNAGRRRCRRDEIGRPASLLDSPQERSMATEILIINQCSVPSDANVQAVIPAVQA